MADWTNPITWGATPITADLLNEQIRDNTEHLKEPPTDSYTGSGSGSYSTSSTSFVDIDAVFDLSITTFGGDVLIAFNFGLTSGSPVGYIDILFDGSRVGGNDGIVGCLPSTENSAYWLLTDIAAGTYTAKLQWKSAGGTISMNTASTYPQFWMREVS